MTLNNSLLWKVESGQGRVSYLFGTMHVRNEVAFRDLEYLKSKILEQNVYYSELDLDSGNMSAVYNSQVLPKNKTVEDYFKREKYRKIREILLKSFKIDIEVLKQFYPMIITNFLLTSVVESNSDFILDQVLYNFAKEKNKDLRYLESADQQIQIFNKIPMELQLKALSKLAAHPAKAKRQMLNLMRYYENKDTRKLYQCSKKQLGKLRKMLLYRRNDNMASLLLHELENTEAFVGVGAAHLFGYSGVLRLLKHGGFNVQPVYL